MEDNILSYIDEVHQIYFKQLKMMSEMENFLFPYVEQCCQSVIFLKMLFWLLDCYHWFEIV